VRLQQLIPLVNGDGKTFGPLCVSYGRTRDECLGNLRTKKTPAYEEGDRMNEQDFSIHLHTA